jgi:hypothetical protein
MTHYDFRNQTAETQIDGTKKILAVSKSNDRDLPNCYQNTKEQISDYADKTGQYMPFKT